MTALEWALIGVAVLALAGCWVMAGCCAMSARLDQQDEDRYGVERARRS